jgi:hypothetical protein
VFFEFGFVFLTLPLELKQGKEQRALFSWLSADYA